MHSPPGTHLTVQGSVSLFLLCEKEEVQLYKDPHMDPQKGKKGTCITQSFGITVFKQICFAFPCPLDSGKKRIIKELKQLCVSL